MPTISSSLVRHERTVTMGIEMESELGDNAANVTIVIGLGDKPDGLDNHQSSEVAS